MESGSNPTLGETIMEAVLEKVEDYITRRQNTIMQYIEMRPIMELYEEADKQLVLRV